jgi:hypothetical protein
VSAYCPTTGYLYLGEGDETVYDSSHSKVTDAWNVACWRVPHHDSEHYSVFRVPLKVETTSIRFAGEPGRFCEGHRAPLAGMTVVGHGKFLATTAKDGNVRLWSTAGGKLLSEMDMKGGTLFGPHTIGEKLLFCADTGPGNPEGAEMYWLRVENSD